VECNWKGIAKKVIASLSPIEREESIAYLEQRVFPDKEALPWVEITQKFDEPIVIAFIDLEPALNWTHNARYLVLDTGGIIRQKIDVDRPPFLTRVSRYLRLIHRGSRAPAWAVVTSPSAQIRDDQSMDIH
jgi:hypothetical protein